MECKLGSREAVLDIASGVVKTSVLFRIKFEDGYFLVPTFGEPKRYEIKKWELVFSVNLEIKDSSDPTAKHKKILDRLEEAGFGKPGDYRIGQLLFDFTAAGVSKYREDLSHMPAFDTAGKTDEEISDIADAKGAFTTYIHKYISRLTTIDPKSGKEPSVLGYIPLVKNEMQHSRRPTSDSIHIPMRMERRTLA
ncbi:hypothetical protein BYT27DRAFT_6865588 [Phlegmacium glaucopus]|nr:hypothetical protein BYT27DRAFT_6865588 [Phlegmacium glaucopus]